MRLFLTRAVEDAARTRGKLEAMGHRVMVSPVIEIVGTGATWPPGVVDAVLATSAQAFGVTFDGPPSEARRVLSLFCVGARTAAMAREAGYVGAATIADDAESLVSAFARLADRPKRILYLAGKDRKPFIEQAFAREGWVLNVVEVYEARPVEPTPEAIKAFGQHAVDGVLHFSRRSAALFVEATQKAGLDPGRPTHYCLSADVAIPLREAGYTKIAIAASPKEPDLLALVGPL